MKVGARTPDARRCVVEFDAGDQDPMEIYEAFERMLAAWPDARVPLKIGADKGTVCGCGTDHGGWTCAHCTGGGRFASGGIIPSDPGEHGDSVPLHLNGGCRP
jgi:hypothetical protein